MTTSKIGIPRHFLAEFRRQILSEFSTRHRRLKVGCTLLTEASRRDGDICDRDFWSRRQTVPLPAAGGLHERVLLDV